MQESQLQGLATQVLWIAFVLAVVFGGVAQRTHFCTMGAVADIVNMGDWSRMRMWVLAVGVAILGFNAMVALGWIEAGDSIYATPKFIWLSNALGGVMFGFGMVLASGCGSKTLVRIGGGNLKSLVVFFVLGLAAFATLKGVTAVARVATVDRAALALPAGQDLPSLLSIATGLARPTLALVLGAAGRRRFAGVGTRATPRAQRRSAARRARDRRRDRRRVVGVGSARSRGRTSADVGGNVPRHQLAAHGVAQLRRRRSPTRSTGCCSSATRARC